MRRSVLRLVLVGLVLELRDSAAFFVVVFFMTGHVLSFEHSDVEIGF